MKEKGIELEKEKKMKMSCDNDDDDFCPPYKVSFPGQDDDYETDPRLGTAQKQKERFYKINGYSDDEDNDDDWGPDGDDDESKCEDESSSKVPLRIIKVPIDEASISHIPDKTSPEVLFSYKRNWKKHFKLAIQNEAKDLKKRDCQCAEAAIKFYNQKHGTDYEIVETRGSYISIFLGFWFHCNFIAQSKSHPWPNPKLFFAELQSKKLPNFIIHNCVPLDHPHPQNNDSGIVRGCFMCGNQLLHPVDGFQAGKTRRSCLSRRVKPGLPIF